MNIMTRSQTSSTDVKKQRDEAIRTKSKSIEVVPDESSPKKTAVMT
jgi:hypothetical protein